MPTLVGDVNDRARGKKAKFILPIALILLTYSVKENVDTKDILTFNRRCWSYNEMVHDCHESRCASVIRYCCFGKPFCTRSVLNRAQLAKPPSVERSRGGCVSNVFSNPNTQ